MDNIQLKKMLYENGKTCLVMDSLNNEIINPEFQAIDRGLYYMLQKAKQQQIRRMERDIKRFNNIWKWSG